MSCNCPRNNSGKYKKLETFIPLGGMGDGYGSQSQMMSYLSSSMSSCCFIIIIAIAIFYLYSQKKGGATK